ncbi:MAG: hypothetical protein HYY65_05100 [Candidatus Tectomicrobia bacterium]|uniref:Uncharacterized protein n=1 Tax=Tectimicrobiota bacterium TaxID=2528274 RepID=A0A932GNZ6_UNCTE|nr:hypothetical protein [Candidatus Tectomicrobia bacterium]
MPAFDLIIVFGGISGLLMVVGGMILLYKGTITLKESNPEEAIKVEFKKMINVTTRYPALGIFVIGLTFITIALYFSKPSAVQPLKVSGKLLTDDPTAATISVSNKLKDTTPSTGGVIEEVIYPNVDKIIFEIVMPGYNPPKIIKTILTQDVRKGVVLLGEIHGGTKVAEKPNERAENIKSAPANLPGLDQSGKF